MVICYLASMPRQARIDIPGLLQHVIVRGIERGKIFLDDTDRDRFLVRLSTLLTETDTDCFAWALIPNHFHLLLRSNRIELKQFMRRLLTGHAITFNIRHKRSGHVFQNRYKSIVCEKDTYLMELVRYIHLNPLRAKLVTDLSALNKYPWSGHSVLMGVHDRPGQIVEEILLHFGDTVGKARNGYFAFMQDGTLQGRRDDLVGGGLRRSRGMQIEQHDDMTISDERVLGSGDFVEGLRREEALQQVMITGMQLPELACRVEQYFGCEKSSIKRRSKDKAVMTARDVYCYLAVRVLRYSGTEVGKILNIQRSAVSHAVRRGEGIVDSIENMNEKILT